MSRDAPSNLIQDTTRRGVGNLAARSLCASVFRWMPSAWANDVTE
jgi:hypothetical protein